METLRHRQEAREGATLSSHAVCAADTRGRLIPEPQCDVRTDFQRDVDRIMYSKSFRRLKRKTQVFLHPTGDHYRTRLTHTLEVSRIAKTIARALRLNEDLTEAIALGHDLGHTPFGHAGERALDAIFSGGFRHFEQSLRIVDHLEKSGEGLNLCHETRQGILNHKHGAPDDTLEAKTVRLSDRIAYINHDADDAIRAGLLAESDLPPIVHNTLGTHHSRRISTIVRDILQNSLDQPDITMSPPVQTAVDEFRNFMFRRVYQNPIAKGEEVKVKDVLGGIFTHYMDNSDKLPADHKARIEQDGLERVVCDYVSGMSDKFALDEYTRLFVPIVWQKA